MGWGPVIRGQKVFVVTCKRCEREVPAGVAAFPNNSIYVRCELCTELRGYRIGEVFLGYPHYLVAKQMNNWKTKGRS